jgi:flagellar hook-basal body complex protein FliE
VLPPVDTSRILALRAQILQQSQALAAADSAPVAAPATGPRFDTAMTDALKAVSAVQNDASAAAAAFERGDSQDLASVMIARQKASIAFEATLQVRNKLLGAYKDVMSMPL